MKVSWQELYAELDGCTKCPLAAGRTHIAVGEGNPHADVMFVGEGPGREEDIQGRPFVGPAGRLLDKMLAAVDFRREDVYIANIVKCRPPGNRNPEEVEAMACLPFLRAQVALIRPKIIVCLGKVAATYIYDSEIRITRDRGKWIERKGVWILPTYHPAALLRDESKKREAWEDFKSLKNKWNELAGRSGGSK